MKTELEKHLLEVVESSIAEAKLESDTIFKNIQKNLEYHIEKNTLEDLYVTELNINALSLLPEYIKNDTNDSFRKFLIEERESLTKSITYKTSYLRSSRTEIAKLESYKELINSYRILLEEIDKFGVEPINK